jgi:SEC-C motif-containing protein
MMKNNIITCPCGSKQPYANCCGRYLDGSTPAPTAEALMRSRYTAYTQQREDYVLATWHLSTRPQAFNLTDDTSKWIGLEVKRHEQQDDYHAIVEFVAKYKANGRAYRLHEVSHFVQQAGHWFYVDGEVHEM